MSIVRSPEDVMIHFGGNPYIFATIRQMSGGFLMRLLQRYQDRVPSGLVLGKTLKFQRKAIIFFGKKYSYPFHIERFERDYKKHSGLV